MLNPSLFKGDFENHILVNPKGTNCWKRTTAKLQPNDHRWRLDSTHVRQGNYSMRIELRPGDTAVNPSDRAEIVGNRDSRGKDVYINDKSGTQYFAFSIRLDKNWVPPVMARKPSQYHGTFLQLHKVNFKVVSGPPFTLDVTDKFRVTTSTGNVYKPIRKVYTLSDSALTPGKWVDFVVKIKYAIDRSGEISVWRRNRGQSNFHQVLSVKKVITLLYLATDTGKFAFDNVWHTGYYRDRQKTDGTGITNILWLDGFTIGTTSAAVQSNAYNSVVNLPNDIASNNTTSSVSINGSNYLSFDKDIDHKSSKFILYPNPAKDICNIQYTTAHSGTVYLEMTDAHGKVLLSKYENFNSGINNIHIDMTRYSAGAYFIYISDEYSKQKLKLLKQ